LYNKILTYKKTKLIAGRKFVMKLFNMQKGGIIISFLFAASVSYSMPTAVQNVSPYTFTLTSSIPTNGKCDPSCASTLAPQAVQAYLLTGSTGSIVLEYDVISGTTRIGHIALKASPASVTIAKGLGATITQGANASLINYVPPTPLWKGAFTDLKNWKTNNWKYTTSNPSWGFNNIQVIAATVNPSPYGTNYLRVRFPKGSANSGSAPPMPLGGAQFYGQMLNTNEPVTLSYYVRFPTTFPFVGGARLLTLGKLPGLYGGTGNTGSKLPTGYDGWSIRLMWCDYSQETLKKVTGGGELVQFTFGSDVGLYGTTKGKFLGCGNWLFAIDGKWHNLQVTVHPNDVGQSNGRTDVCYDGKLVFSQGGIIFRKSTALATNGILFQTFFGGTGADYATPSDTYIDFADFTIYPYPASASDGLCVTNVK
jgi:hypothetical protein